MFNLYLNEIILATWQTLVMVFVAAIISIAVGLTVGVIVFLTGKKQPLANTVIHNGLVFLINGLRSLPFIILLICIVPFTQWLVGTTIGSVAAIVPLTLAATPFFARVCFSAFSDVDSQLFLVANAFGATTWHFVSKVLIAESRPALIKGATLTAINLIGYSAMAGAIGGGGLGELAINYGYQRFNTVVIVETVIVLIVIVQLLQLLGDYFSRKSRSRGLLGFVVVLALALSAPLLVAAPHSTAKVLRVGVTSSVDEDLLKVAEKQAWKRYHLRIQPVVFSDYVQPNVALNNGSIDANIFQHRPYLDAQIQAHGYHIKALAKTFVFPFGFYSKKIHSLKDVPEHALIALPNDPSNEGRALLLLAKAHLIGLRGAAGLFARPQDIISNRLHLRFIELDAAQIPRALTNVVLGGLTNDYAKPAGFRPRDALILESADSLYANVIAVRSDIKNKKLYQQLVEVIHSKAYEQAVLTAFPQGAAVIAR